jgi:hypothetical protein
MASFEEGLAEPTGDLANIHLWKTNLRGSGGVSNGGEDRPGIPFLAVEAPRGLGRTAWLVG